jgi:hypothetical protein
MKKLIVMLLFSIPLLSQAELVVVTGSDSTIISLTELEVRQLFSGQLKAIAGQRVQPLDLPNNARDRDEFYRKLMGRSPEQMRAYWTRLIFTGQGKPPREVSNTQELSTLVSSGEYIGYLPAEADIGDMRILYRIR